MGAVDMSLKNAVEYEREEEKEEDGREESNVNRTTGKCAPARGSKEEVWVAVAYMCLLQLRSKLHTSFHVLPPAFPKRIKLLQFRQPASHGISCVCRIARADLCVSPRVLE